MADKQLSALTAAGAIADADLFYATQSGNSRKVTGTQLKTYAQSGFSSVNPGLINVLSIGMVSL